MPTPTKGTRLGGSPAHERLMLANLATSLFEHDRITTTEAKAKRLRPLAEKLITFAKRGDLHARRQVMTVIRDKDVVHKLFAEIGPKMADRPGGYTRIIKTNPRKGDNAPMAVIEIVEELKTVTGEAEKARGTKVAASQGADRSHQGDRRGRRGRVRDRRRGRCRRGSGRGAAAAAEADDDAADDRRRRRPGRDRAVRRRRRGRRDAPRTRRSVSPRPVATRRQAGRGREHPRRVSQGSSGSPGGP